jgi:hypothetical protein
LRYAKLPGEIRVKGDLRTPGIDEEGDRVAAMNRFLGFRREKLEARLRSVIVAHSRLIKPAEIKSVDGIFRLH